jgi:hypothetical protein
LVVEIENMSPWNSLYKNPKNHKTVSILTINQENVLKSREKVEK